jgi:hypothetical protein
VSTGDTMGKQEQDVTRADDHGSPSVDN